jgi:hypothetical protein
MVTSLAIGNAGLQPPTTASVKNSRICGLLRFLVPNAHNCGTEDLRRRDAGLRSARQPLRSFLRLNMGPMSERTRQN